MSKTTAAPFGLTSNRNGREDQLVGMALVKGTALVKVTMSNSTPSVTATGVVLVFSTARKYVFAESKGGVKVTFMTNIPFVALVKKPKSPALVPVGRPV